MRRAILLIVLGCGKTTPPPTPTPETTTTTVASVPTPAKDPGCGALACKQYDKLDEAFGVVLARKPLVVAIGEAHAQKGKEGIASSAKHFTDEVLPSLSGKASDLIVELMMPARLADGGACVQVAAAVKEKQKVVTNQQASTNQNEYEVMGIAAKKLGVIPDLLRPTCDDLDAINKAGDLMVDVSLQTIKRLTAEKVKRQLERNAKTPADADKLVVTYGGALHNDLNPSNERAAWSFGPELSKHTSGRYVEVDLYVSDYIEDTDNWKKLEWYSAYDKQKLGSRVTMFEPHDGSFVIIIPHAP